MNNIYKIFISIIFLLNYTYVTAEASTNNSPDMIDKPIRELGGFNWRLRGNRDKVIENAISNAIFTHDGRYLVIRTYLGKISILDTKTWETTHETLIAGEECELFSPPNPAFIAILSDHKNLAILNVKTAAIIKSIAISRSEVPIFSRSGSVYLLNKGKVRIISPNGVISIKNADIPETRYASLSPDEKLLATEQRDEVTIWDFKKWKIIKQLKKRGSSAKDYPYWYGDIEFSHDGKKLAAADGALFIWNTSNWKPSFAIDRKNGNDIAMTVSFSYDDKVLVTNQHGIKYWNVQNGNMFHRIPNYDFLSAECNPTKPLISSTHLDGCLRLFRLSKEIPNPVGLKHRHNVNSVKKQTNRPPF